MAIGGIAATTPRVKQLAVLLGALALFVAGGLTALADDGAPPGVTTTTADASTTTAATTTDAETTTTVPTTTTTPAPPTRTITLPTRWPFPFPKNQPKPAPTTPSKPSPAPTTTAAAAPPPPPAHLVVTAAATPTTGVTIGATVDYSFAVANTGGQPVAATFADQLPLQVVPIEADGSQGSCSTAQSVQCALGSIAAGATVTVVIATQVGQVGAFADSASVRPAVSVQVDQAAAIQLEATRATPVRLD